MLIDGQGQYADRDKVLNLQATGHIEQASYENGIGYTRMNATPAYRVVNENVKRCVREIYFLNHAYFVIVDHVDLEKEGQVSWLLHAKHKMVLDNQSFRINGEKADMQGRFVYVSSGEMQLTQDDRFLDVDPSEIEGLSKEWHLTATTPKAASHRIVTLLVPMKRDDARYVSYFMDDQDHGVHVYFTDQGITQRVVVPKAY